jgi:hypothetical protein
VLLVHLQNWMLLPLPLPLLPLLILVSTRRKPFDSCGNLPNAAEDACCFHCCCHSKSPMAAQSADAVHHLLPCCPQHAPSQMGALPSLKMKPQDSSRRAA